MTTNCVRLDDRKEYFHEDFIFLPRTVNFIHLENEGTIPSEEKIYSATQCIVHERVLDEKRIAIATAVEKKYRKSDRSGRCVFSSKTIISLGRVYVSSLYPALHERPPT